jgi:putative CocE/NonD family hydrolase
MSLQALNRKSLILLASYVFCVGPLSFAADNTEYDVVAVKDIMIPMRDGVQLATDLYLPARDGVVLQEKLPAVLMRTPYNKEKWGIRIPRFFARHGFMSVVQDCRGRFKSEGKFFAFRDEAQDGYDTIEWLAKHPQCNGKVGMHGVSHMGWVQIQAATQKPPHLVTMIPHCGPTNAYKYSMHVGGTRTLGLLRWHLQMAASSQEARKNPDIIKALKTMNGSNEKFLQWATRIPWRRGQTPLSLVPNYEESAFQLYFENNDYSEFWHQPGLGMDEYFDNYPDIPICWTVGWYEVYTRSISDGFQAMIKRGNKNQHIIIGPWTHNNFNLFAGDVNFGAKGGNIRSYDDWLNFELRWFNRWLKNDTNSDISKPVNVFIMGGGEGTRDPQNGRLNHGGEWFHGDNWPPESVEPTNFYLHGDGTLSKIKPTQRHSSTTYTYDPRDTVSSDGRCEIAYGPAAKKGFSGMGPYDQIQWETLPGHGLPGMPIAARPDVLVYQTPPLEEDVRIAGNVNMVLWVSSDAPDTDFFVKLIDVYPPSSKDYPAGYAFPVTDGIIRARYREGFEKPLLMQPNKVYRVEFPMQPGANLFKRGHRIRIDICSSNFPNFDINRNTGNPNDRRWRLADNTIYHEAAKASYIVLPVFPIITAHQ